MYAIEYQDVWTGDPAWHRGAERYQSAPEANSAIRGMIRLGGAWEHRAYRVVPVHPRAPSHPDLARLSAQLRNEGAIVAFWADDDGSEALIVDEEIMAALPNGPVRRGVRIGGSIEAAIRKLLAWDVAQRQELAAALERERAAERERAEALERERKAAEERERAEQDRARAAAAEREREQEEARQRWAAEERERQRVERATIEERERAEQERARIEAHALAAAAEREQEEARQRWAAEEYQRRAAEEYQRRAAEEYQRRAAEEYQRRAAEEYQRRAAEEYQRRAAEEYQRRAAQERVERERRVAQERERRAAEERERQRVERDRRAAEERERQRVERAASEERERRAAEAAEERQRIERDRRAAEERERAVRAPPPTTRANGPKDDLALLARLLRCGPWSTAKRAGALLSAEDLPVGARDVLRTFARRGSARSLGNVLKRFADVRVDGIPLRLVRRIDGHRYARWQVVSDCGETQGGAPASSSRGAVGR